MSEEILEESAIGAETNPEQDVQDQEVVEPTEEVAEPSLEENIEALAAEDGGEASTDPAPEADEYVPNYKYKAGGEEKEFDEVFKGAFTSKEAEDAFRDLHERAGGLESIKEDRESVRGELATTTQAFQEQSKAVETLGNYLNDGDLESFFTALEIPKEQVMKYALQQAQMGEWTPEQKAAYDNQRESKRRANLYEEGYNSKDSEVSSLRQDMVVQDYKLELYKPEVRDFQEAFDTEKGPQAFEDEVARLGKYHEKVDGEILPVSQLVKTVMDKYSPFMQARQPAANGGSVATPAPSVTEPKEVPVIPNTGPSGKAPAQKAITSLEDIEKLANSL